MHCWSPSPLHFHSSRIILHPPDSSWWPSRWVLQVEPLSGSRRQSASCPADWFLGPAAACHQAADQSALLLHLRHRKIQKLLSIFALYFFHNILVSGFNMHVFIECHPARIINPDVLWTEKTGTFTSEITFATVLISL